MKKGYAYIDKGGIMHVVEEMQTAIDYAKKGTKINSYEGSYDRGYPIANDEMIIVYSPDEMKYSGNGDKIPVISELAELYKKCANL